MPELLLRPDPLLLRAELLRVPELRPAEDGRCAEDFADDLPERDCAMIYVPLLLKAPRPFSGCAYDVLCIRGGAPAGGALSPVF